LNLDLAYAWKSLRAMAWTVVTFLVSVAVGGALTDEWWPWLAMSAILLAHELGHVYVGARRNIRLSPPVFVPFLGAFVQMDGDPATAYDEALMAAGGPLAGVMATTVVLAVGKLLSFPSLLSLARAGFIIHLINLLPFLPLDGGRILGGVSTWAWHLAVPILSFWLLFAGPGFIAGLLFILAILSGPRRVPRGYGVITGPQRLHALALYGSLVLVTVSGALSAGGTWEWLAVYLGIGADHWFTPWESLRFTAYITGAYLILWHGPQVGRKLLGFGLDHAGNQEGLSDSGTVEGGPS